MFSKRLGREWLWWGVPAIPVVPAKKVAGNKWPKFPPFFQRSYMGGPMSLRDFEDDEMTTSNCDLVGDDSMP